VLLEFYKEHLVRNTWCLPNAHFDDISLSHLEGCASTTSDCVFAQNCVSETAVLAATWGAALPTVAGRLAVDTQCGTYFGVRTATVAAAMD
jgi:hypothetical protein